MALLGRAILIGPIASVVVSEECDGYAFPGKPIGDIADHSKTIAIAIPGSIVPLIISCRLKKVLKSNTLLEILRSPGVVAVCQIHPRWAGCLPSHTRPRRTLLGWLCCRLRSMWRDTHGPYRNASPDSPSISALRATPPDDASVRRQCHSRVTVGLSIPRGGGHARPRALQASQDNRRLDQLGLGGLGIPRFVRDKL
jgi:hypothetical protein